MAEKVAQFKKNGRESRPIMNKTAEKVAQSRKNVRKKVAQFWKNGPKRAEYVDTLGNSSNFITKLPNFYPKQGTLESKNYPI